MKTSIIEVRDMLSVLSVLGVEKKIGEVPGVESVTVNYAAGNATVRYDETRLDIADIKSDVRQSGYESAAPADASAGGGHKGHTTPGAPSATPVAAAPKPIKDSPAAAMSASPPSDGKDGKQDKAAPGADAPNKVAAAPKSSPAAAPTSAAPKSAPNAAAAAPAGGAPGDDGKKDKGAPDKS